VTWLLSNALAVAVATALLDGIWFSGPVQGEAEIKHKFLPLLFVAVIMGLVSMLVKPVVQILSIPFIIVTLGLFLWVINALMLKLTAGIAGLFGIGFHVHGFWTALLGALIITLVNFFVDRVIDDKPSRRWGGSRSPFSSRRF
jgi:putative membrane protein